MITTTQNQKVIHPTNAFVSSDDDFSDVPPATSYIDLDDLRECLQLHYQNQLDNIDTYIDRLYLPCRNLNPDNTLFGQLDSDTLRSALYKVAPTQASAIEFYYTQDQELNSQLQHDYFLAPGHYIHYSDWLTDQYTQAIAALALEIKKLI